MLQLRAMPQQRVPAQLPAVPCTRGRGGPAGVADTQHISDCRHHLCEPDMKLVWPSAKLLQAAAGASLRSYHRLTHSVLPLLLEQYNKHSQVRGTPASWHWAEMQLGPSSHGELGCAFVSLQSSQRRTILEMLLGFLELQQKWGHVEEGEAGPSAGTHIPLLCPGGLLALPSPSPTLMENKSSLTWGQLLCSPPGCARDPAWV